MDIQVFQSAGYDMCVVDGRVNIITEGVYFDVIVFDDVVVKIPKKPTNNFNEKLDLEQMVSIQNYLAKHMSEVEPATLFNNMVITKKATGIRSDIIKDNKFREVFDRKVKIMTDYIDHLGVEISDITRRNIFIDGDKWQLIDFSGARFKPPE